MSFPNSTRPADDERVNRDTGGQDTSRSLALARSALATERGRVAALSLFARRLSHDLSNFVTVVRTYSELLLSDLEPASGTHADVVEIHRASEAIVEYMQRVARFARVTSSRSGTVSLDAAVDDLVRQLETTGPITSSLASNAMVTMDAQLLNDALREVLENAREASPATGTVRVSTWTQRVDEPLIDGGVPIEIGDWGVVEISDEGAGFTAENSRQSLDPFVTTKNGVRGAGIGLSLVRGAVWNAGGHVVLSARRFDYTESTMSNEPGGHVRLWLPTTAASAPAPAT